MTESEFFYACVGWVAGSLFCEFMNWLERKFK